MFVRNFLAAGDYLTIVPLSLPVTLQYNTSGFLEKVMRGYENDVIDITEDTKQVLVNNHIVPKHIQIKNGTSWVSGCLYTAEYFPVEGNIPNDLTDVYVKKLKEDPSKFSFFAGVVSSLAATFRGAVPIRQWLALAGFELLPGFVIPADLTELKLEKMITSSRTFNFVYPLITNYIIFSKSSVNYYDLGFKQIHVQNTEEFIDDEGYVKTSIKLDNEDLVIDYSEKVRMNVQEGCYILLDESDKILHCYDPKKRKTLKEITGNKTTCPVCGRIYNFSDYGKVRCKDEHCNSRLFKRVNQLLSTFDLDTISRDKYDEIIKNVGSIFSVPDILDQKEYRELVINCRLSRAMRAIVPEEVVPGFDGFVSFCNRCNNNVESVLYYIHNPDKAVQDLKLYQSETDYGDFVKWIEDPENVADIHSIIIHPNINLSDTDKTLQDVAPIFRGTTILITGIFKHGDHNTINSILSSYGAEVTTRFSERVDLVITGSTREGVNGSFVRKAIMRKLSIYEEDEFFKKYEIDKDIEENL